MAVDVIVGLQRGDEGKGRFVDMLAEEHDIVARFNGGNNAGHTVELPDKRVLKLHLVPSGIAHPNIVNVIGNGTLINPVKLVEEIDDIKSKDIDVSPENLKISSGAHLILPNYIFDDEIREAGVNRQGSTKSGIAQVASQKAMRTGVRVEMIEDAPKDLYYLVKYALIAQRQLRKEAGLKDIDEEHAALNYIKQARKLGAYITDTATYLNNELRKEQPARILAEGAQAFLLDIDHGMYPFTSSSSTTSGGVPNGLGIPPNFIDKVIGVAKAVHSHVGDGPFVTEIKDTAVLAKLHGNMNTVDAEYGTTTGRKRRLGYLDIVELRKAIMINGVSSIALSKLDWLTADRTGNTLPICTHYEMKGQILETAPDSAFKLEQCTPIYEELPAIQENIQGVRKFEDLPQNAQNIVNFIEEKTKTPISMIGVGPNRDQVIIK
ncbi:adenylosuccinate synthase [Candidatus Saccharibacteria bacterium]|nr:adenylosuccinate synthase [Candidatus Saccharibacteria bacterium]MBP7834784.1 adenylosuccinate synthase [Candidatus Saccharibacteria bacterium]